MATEESKQIFVGGRSCGRKGVCGRFMSPVQETQSMREIRPLRGRLPCKGGGLTGMAYTVGLRTAVYVLLPYIILFFKHKAGISLCQILFL